MAVLANQRVLAESSALEGCGAAAGDMVSIFAMAGGSACPSSASNWPLVGSIVAWCTRRLIQLTGMNRASSSPVSGPHVSPSLIVIMSLHTNSESLPADFVAFLAQRSGLSQEAAETRLERWLGEYHSSAGDRRASARLPAPSR